MKQTNIFNYLMIFIVTCSLVFPIPTSCFTMPAQLTKFFATPYGKPACFVVCAYLAVRTIGYLISDGESTETTNQTNYGNNNNQQETSINPVSLACLASIAASLTSNVIDSTFKLWGSESGVPEYTSIEEVAKFQKPIKDLIGSPREIAIAICQEVIANYRSANKYPPTNYLLCGIPGVGKSDLAAAAALEVHEKIGSDAIFVTGSTFNTEYSGQGAAKVRALMKEAIKRTQKGTKPVFICIDEIDALGSRDTTDKGCGLSQSQTINELLAQISFVQKQYPIYIIATTNHEKALGHALLRRFERLEVKGLAKNQMLQFINKERKNHSLSPSIKTSDILRLVEDIPSVAFVKGVFKRAHGKARKNHRSKITLEDFKQAARGCQKEYRKLLLRDWKIEANDDRIAFGYLRDAHEMSGKTYSECEDRFRERTGYDGKRMYGKGGSFCKDDMTPTELWKKEEIKNAREAVIQRAVQYQMSLDQERRATEQHARNTAADERAKKLYRQSLEQDKRSKTAHAIALAAEKRQLKQYKRFLKTNKRDDGEHPKRVEREVKGHQIQKDEASWWMKGWNIGSNAVSTFVVGVAVQAAAGYLGMPTPPVKSS